MKKRVVALGLAFVMAASMTGCGSTASSSAAASEPREASSSVAAESSVAESSAGDTSAAADTSAATGGVITMEKSDAEWITEEDINSLANNQQYVVGFTDNFDGNTLHQ